MSSNFFLNFLRPIKKIKFASVINGKIEVLETEKGKIIYVNGAEQTGGTITGMWEKALSFLKSGKPKAVNCLLLGLGGGDVVRILRKFIPDVKITVIELDPEMIKVAGDYFQIRESVNLKIINEDAEIYVKKTAGKFDLIIVDLFVGKFNPQNFRTAYFFSSLKRKLNQKGMIIYNSHYIPENPDEFMTFYKVIKNIFKKPEIIIEYRYSRIVLLRH